MPLVSGSAFTAYDLPPWSEGVFHRSITLDYVIVISGRIVLCLEGGERVSLHEGDVVVQQATMHAWSNESGEWTRLYGVMVPARAPVVEGRVLEDVWPF
jgi:quercetin dioxygenase-like cupin family protein